MCPLRPDVFGSKNGGCAAWTQTFPFIIYLVMDIIMEIYGAKDESGGYEIFQDVDYVRDVDLQLEADLDHLEEDQNV